MVKEREREKNMKNEFKYNEETNTYESGKLSIEWIGNKWYVYDSNKPYPLFRTNILNEAFEFGMEFSEYALIDLLAKAKSVIESFVEDYGSCDHDVNICICYEKELLREIEEVLK